MIMPVDPRVHTDDPPTPWEPGFSVDRQALLFSEGDVIVADSDRPDDVARLRSEWEGNADGLRLARVRVTVLEIEPRPASLILSPDAVDLLRRIRDMPNLNAAFRAELDAVLAGDVP